MKHVNSTCFLSALITPYRRPPPPVGTPQMYFIRALVASALLSLLGTPSLIQASAVDQVHLTRGTDAAGNPQITLGIDPSEGFT